MTADKKLLQLVPRPLLDDLVAGRWLPIVGAGLSMNAVVPGASGNLPNWKELGDEVAKDLPPGHSVGEPIENLSAYEYAYGRQKLVGRIGQALKVGSAVPGKVHRAFCSIPFEVVVTTNVEQLLETEYRSRHGAVLAMIEEQQLRLTNPYGAPVLVKLHGDLHHPSSLVLTESDYDSVVSNRPVMMTWLANQLIHRTGVLIGYSLEDADFRQVLVNLKSRLGSVPPDLYVLEVGADAVRVDRYERRGVRVINLPKTRRGYAILEDFFEALYEYWTQQFPKLLTGTTASVRALLRAGERTETAVLFVVDNDSLSLYDEFVFPSLIGRGFVPLTIQDVSHPPGYRVATLEALLRVAGLVVLDNIEPAESASIKAINALGDARVLRIRESLGLPESEASAAPMRPENTEDWPAFGMALADFLFARSSIIQEQGRPNTSRATNFESLRASNDLLSAVILGFVDIERRLASLAERDGMYKSPSRPLGLRQLLDYAVERYDLALPIEDVQNLTRARNELVHGKGAPSQQALGQLATQIQSILLRLEGIGA